MIGGIIQMSLTDFILEHRCNLLTDLVFGWRNMSHMVLAAT